MRIEKGLISARLCFIRNLNWGSYKSSKLNISERRHSFSWLQVRRTSKTFYIIGYKRQISYIKHSFFKIDSSINVWILIPILSFWQNNSQKCTKKCILTFKITFCLLHWLCSDKFWLLKCIHCSNKGYQGSHQISKSKGCKSEHLTWHLSGSSHGEPGLFWLK